MIIWPETNTAQNSIAPTFHMITNIKFQIWSQCSGSLVPVFIVSENHRNSQDPTLALDYHQSSTSSHINQMTSTISSNYQSQQFIIYNNSVHNYLSLYSSWAKNSEQNPQKTLKIVMCHSILVLAIARNSSLILHQLCSTKPWV